MTSLDRTSLRLPAGATLDFNFRSRRASIRDVSGGPVRSAALDNILTFTRPSVATVLGPAGVLADAAANVPRYRYNPASGRALGLEIEGSKTNLLLQSNNFGISPWTIGGSPIIRPAAEVGLRGTVTATRLTDGDPTNPNPLGQSVTIPTTSLPYAAGWWLRQVPGGANLWRVRMRFLGGTSTLEGTVVYDLATGTIVSADPGFSGRPPRPGPFGLWGCEISGTNSVGATSCVMQLERANASDSSQTVDLCNAQMEQDTQLSSVIDTTTTQVNRAAETVRLPLGSWFNPVEGCLVVEYITQANPGATQYIASFRGPSVVMSITKSLFGPSIAVGATGGSTLTMYGVAKDVQQRAFFGYKANDFIAGKFGGGANYTGNTGDNAMVTAANAVPSGLTTLDIGNNNGSAQLNGVIGRLIYFPSRKPVVNLASLIT